MRIVARLLVLLPLLWAEGTAAQECNGQFLLTSQLQVDEFPILNEGCDYAVSVGISGDDVVNLDGLENLKEVNRLSINSSALTDITGLTNLIYVWQELAITAPNLKSLEGLHNAAFYGVLFVDAPIEEAPPLDANGSFFIGLTGTRLTNLDALADVATMRSSYNVLYGTPGLWIRANPILSDCSALAPLLGWPNIPHSPETDLIDDNEAYQGRTDFIDNAAGANSADDCLNSFSIKDNDGDGIQNIDDNCLSDSNANQADNDEDSSGDACDSDDDNDGVLDSRDLYPFIPIGDLTDTDRDGAPDECDAACLSLGMQADDDDDNDGVKDSLDCDPLDSIASFDTDGDEICDVYDDDDDNDGVPDWEDGCPLDASGFTDNDLDNVCDVSDLDDDNDGLSDEQELALGTNPLKGDTDGDGWSDKEEFEEGTDPLQASSQPEWSYGIPIWLLYQATQ